MCAKSIKLLALPYSKQIKNMYLNLLKIFDFREGEIIFDFLRNVLWGQIGNICRPGKYEY